MADDLPDLAGIAPLAGAVRSDLDLGIADLIVDFADGRETVDLSDLLVQVDELTITIGEPSEPSLDASGGATRLLAADGGTTFVEAASLTAIHATLSILYEDDRIPVTDWGG